MKIKELTVAACMVAWTCSGQAQQKSRGKDYARTPLWVTMMNDPGANFFEVEKAFRIYWQHHEPEEGETEEMAATQNGRITRRKRMELMEVSRMEVLVKQYRAWKMSVLPFVRPDGSIPSPAERMAIWQQINDNRK